MEEGVNIVLKGVLKMIVVKKEDTFLMFEQHEHAKVSGLMASYWSDELFFGKGMKEEAVYAISQHDRAWIPLDERPKWNEEKESPHSFMDHPLEDKIAAYERGVDEIEKESGYAALLCSIHFTAFLDKNTDNPIITQYISREIDRQTRLIKKYDKSVTEKELNFHIDLLRFCDSLSLYICLNEPGIPKFKENNMFINGFPQIFEGIGEAMNAYWIGEEFVSVEPFPFKESFDVSIPFKRVGNGAIESLGLRRAYDEAPIQYRKLTIGKK